MIAALLTYDDQILGTLLTRLLLDKCGVDLGNEKMAKGWFEQRVRTTNNNCWVSRQLHVLDLLILGFDWRREQRQPPETAPVTPPVKTWDNEGEVENWWEALDRLRGRCSFCVGQGLGGDEIRHTLRKCRREGAEKVRETMGGLLYHGDYDTADGCHLCYLPGHFCSRWEPQSGGH
ncbi:hypothetical protein BN1708_015430 [Verticillium longisporum]|uniref:Uncharacterized protein n=1 Tax=Verticillium longisporum TaxID=100787 RepID=A0A0G4M4V2_VERLO|nr:hypothetical protein BN1708_015430 [Verticillium longisporum]